MEGLIRVVILVIAFAGMYVATHIYKVKLKKQTLICPLGYNCNSVIHSKYSSFLSVPVELLGVAYYGIVVFSYIIFSFVPALTTNEGQLSILILTTVAFLFTIYLAAIQIFRLRQFCSWCLASEFIVTAIFVLSAVSTPYDVVQYFVF